MLITYRNQKLKKLLKNHTALVKKYGIQVAEKTMQRMNELDSAITLADLPPAVRPHPYQPKNLGKFSVDINKHKHPLRLLFYAVEPFDILDYSTIKNIKIDRIEKLHS